MSVKRPDAFICNNCGTRFNNKEKKTLKKDEEKTKTQYKKKND